MTGIAGDDTRLLVLFGEMRGDVKSLLRQNKELANRLSTYEDAVSSEITNLDERVRKLEGIKLRVAGFTAALGMVAGLVGSNFLGALVKLNTLIGG